MSLSALRARAARWALAPAEPLVAAIDPSVVVAALPAQPPGLPGLPVGADRWRPRSLVGVDSARPLGLAPAPLPPKARAVSASAPTSPAAAAPTRKPIRARVHAVPREPAPKPAATDGLGLEEDGDAREEREADPAPEGEYVIRRMPRPTGPSLPADREREAEMIARYQAGEDRAGDALLRMHAGMIWRLIRPWRRAGDAATEDIHQEAKMGFLRAVKLYDSKYGAQLLTYCAYHTRQAAQRFVQNHARTIRAPAYTWCEKKVSDETKAMADRTRTVSLHVAFGSDGDRTLEDVLADDCDVESEVGDVESAAHHAAVVAALCRDLPARERSIIQRRFLAEDPATLAEIGERCGLTKERIRQIEAKTIGKLRARLKATGARNLNDLDGRAGPSVT